MFIIHVLSFYQESLGYLVIDEDAGTTDYTEEPEQAAAFETQAAARGAALMHTGCFEDFTIELRD